MTTGTGARGWGWVGLVAAACQLPALEHAAPLAVRNQHPAQLTAMLAGPRPGRAVPAGRLEVETSADWTTLFLRPGVGRDRIELDGETVRVAPRLRAGLGRGVDVSVALPFLAASGGILDGFIEAWHDAFGFPQGGRDLFPRGRFLNRASKRDASGRLRTAYDLDETGLAIGDLPITAAWFPLDGEGPVHLGLRAGIELPTGDETRGAGNGGVDRMVGFVGEWAGRGWSAFLWGGWAWIPTPDRARRAGLAYRDHPSLGAGLQVGLLDWVSFVGQVDWERSVLADLANSHAKQNQVLIWTGARFRLSAVVDLEAAVGEDLIQDVAPDVTFHLGARLHL